MQKAKQKHNRPLNSGWALSAPQSCCIISILPPSSLSSRAWPQTPSLVLSTSALSKGWEVPRPLSPRVRILTSGLALPVSHLGSLGKSRNSSLLVQRLLGPSPVGSTSPGLHLRAHTKHPELCWWEKPCKCPMVWCPMMGTEVSCASVSLPAHLHKWKVQRCSVHSSISWKDFNRHFHAMPCCGIYLLLPSASWSIPTPYFRQISTILLHLLLQTKACSKPPWWRNTASHNFTLGELSRAWPQVC